MKNYLKVYISKPRSNKKLIKPMLADRESTIKRLIYQSHYRGCKETDIILSRFAKRYLFEFNDMELGLYQELLNQSDKDIFDWLSGNQKIPDHLRNSVTNRLLGYKLSDDAV